MIGKLRQPLEPTLRLQAGIETPQILEWVKNVLLGFTRAVILNVLIECNMEQRYSDVTPN